MVSIMRSEQTLRLIQLYHANYPEIARNNQDADGRNLKLQMWAQITEELNRTFETAFTVEQFKKKVQNVQCTSRQKLFSGKRNLGEAEVEYLRLFESDKISEETLGHRAKNRRMSANNSATDFLMLRERQYQTEEYQMGKIDDDEEGEGEDEREEENATEEGGGSARTSGGTEEGPNRSGGGTAPEAEANESGAVTAALSSIGALFGTYGGETRVETPMDMWTQQILLAMVNAASMNDAATPVGGASGRENGGTEEDNGRAMMKGTERKRRQPFDEEEEARRKAEAAHSEESVPKRKDSQTDERRERDAGGEPSWAGELFKMQREVLGQQRQMLAHFANIAPKVPRVASSSASDLASSLSNPSPASSSSSASPLPSSSFAPHAVLCQCSTNGSGSASLHSLERELCARLDTTNAMLARVVELILERLPPIG